MLGSVTIQGTFSPVSDDSPGRQLVESLYTMTQPKKFTLTENSILSWVIYLPFGDSKVRGRYHGLHLFATYLSLECGLKAVGHKTIHHLPRPTEKRNYLLGSLLAYSVFQTFYECIWGI